MSKPSLLRTIWRRIWHPTGFVGRDLEGNSYFEWGNPLKSAGYARTKRSVKYRNPEDMWNYIGGSKRLPIQWSAWLAHTRAHPPSVEELQIDLIRQQRVQHNAALIEARFQQERTQLIQEASPPPFDGPSSQAEQPSVDPSLPVSPPPESLPTTEGFTPNTLVAQRPGSTLPKTGSDEYQPETWTPKARVRRG